MRCIGGLDPAATGAVAQTNASTLRYWISHQSRWKKLRRRPRALADIFASPYNRLRSGSRISRYSDSEAGSIISYLLRESPERSNLSARADKWKPGYRWL